MSSLNIVFNYCLNKYVPYLFIGFILFWHLGYETWAPYVVMAFVLFIDKFSFKTGYSVAYCKKNGIDIERPPE